MKTLEILNNLIRTESVNGGVQKVFRFPNDYGASVVRHQFSYGGDDGLWELAVIHFTEGNNELFELDYKTNITTDVMGWLTEDEVEETLTRIKELGKYKKETITSENRNKLRPWKVVKGETVTDSAMTFEYALHSATIRAGFSSQLETEEEMELFTEGKLFPYNIMYKPTTEKES